jgi:hypothetical protein
VSIYRRLINRTNKTRPRNAQQESHDHIRGALKPKKQQTFKQVVMLSERNWKDLRTISRHVSKIIRTPLQKTEEKILVSAMQYAFYDYDAMTPAERKQLGDEARALLANAKQDKRTITVGPYTDGRLLDLANQGGEVALIAFLECAVSNFLRLMEDERTGYAGSRPCPSKPVEV